MRMFKFHQTPDNLVIAELINYQLIISQVQDALDLIADMGTNSCSRIIIYERNFHPDFFDLKTKLAGEVLQKFSNYRLKLAIVGDFSKYNSKSMQDFIRESNKGNTVFFLDSIDSALSRLSK
jgi:hypothetical protein